MKNLIIVFLLVFNLSVFAQEKPSEKCTKISVERIDPARVKVVKHNTCTNVYTIKTYLVTEWNRIQAEKRKKRKNRAKKQ